MSAHRAAVITPDPRADARQPGLARGRAREATRLVGMTVFLGSWAVAFTSLFFAYLFLRVQSQLPWPPAGAPEAPLLRPALNTMVALVGSAFVHRAAVASRVGLAPVAARWLAVAAGAGVVFLTLQALVWSDLWAAGLVLPNGNRYASVFYTLTGFHALHVAVGIAGLARLSWRARRGVASPSSVRLWGLFWHFVGIVWLVMFVALYLL